MATISRKQIKRQDRFAEAATGSLVWVLERRRRVGLMALGAIAVVAVLIGVQGYEKRQETRAAALLAVALEIYGSPIEDPENAASPEGGGATPSAADEHAPSGHRHYSSEDAKLEAAAIALGPIIEEYGRYPSGSFAYYYLGLCFYALERVDKAIEAFSAAAESDLPLLSSIARYRLGLTYSDEGRNDEAIEVLETLVQETDSAFPVEEALMAKARAHLAMGNQQAAMVTFQRIVESYSASLYASQALQRAEELAADLGVDLTSETP